MITNKLVEDSRAAYLVEKNKREKTLRLRIKKVLGGEYTSNLTYDGEVAYICGTDYMLYINEFNELRMQLVGGGQVFAISKLSQIYLVLSGQVNSPERF